MVSFCRQTRTWLAMGLLLPQLALAHAHLQQSVPAANSAGPAPAQLQLQFNEGIELAFSSVQLLNAAGKPVALAKLAAGTEPGRVQVALPPLPVGSYRVEWAVLSVDGHRSKGHFQFVVN